MNHFHNISFVVVYTKMGVVLSLPWVLLGVFVGSSTGEDEDTSMNKTDSHSGYYNGTYLSKYGTRFNQSLTNSSSWENDDTSNGSNNAWIAAPVIGGVLLCCIIVCCIIGICLLSREKNRSTTAFQMQTQHHQPDQQIADTVNSSVAAPEKAHLRVEDVETLVGEEEFQNCVASDIESAKTKC